MVNKYRFWLCPKPGCPKFGKQGQRCPTHSMDLKPFILIREKPEIPDALKTNDMKTSDLIDSMFKRSRP